VFGEDETAVYLDLESPFAAGDKGQLLNDVLVVAEYVFRHTDGTG
jgi:hypothetical protein